MRSLVNLVDNLTLKNGKNALKIINRLRHGIKFDVVWFAKESVKTPGIITYHQAEFKGKDATEFVTLVNDITEDEEQIKAKFAKNCKYEVNRGERENIEPKMISSADDMPDSDIDSFLDFFKEFWESKGMDFENYESVKRDLYDYKSEKALAISCAVIDGERSVYHTYIFDENRARLLHSASLYRLKNDDEGTSKKIIGIANRYLHYRDMLYFKEQGLSVYDWGGAGKEEEVINITKFKESFGGMERIYYDFEETRGFKARLFKILAGIKEDALNFN